MTEPRDPALPSPSADGPGGPLPTPAASASQAASPLASSPSASSSPSGTSTPSDPTQDEAPAHRGERPSRISRRPSRRNLPVWLDTLITMAVAVLIAVLVKTFLVQPFYIPSASMNPTLLQDDKILVSKLHPGVFDLERGDVIVFEDTANWIPGDATDNPTLRVRFMMVLSLIGLAPDPSQDHLVKRLIGMPGDHVVCESQGSQLQINGTVIDEPYINPETPACQVAFDVTVPEGHVWVMGDNRFASADSAYHEELGQDPFIAIDDITGKAQVVFWPIGRWSGLGGGNDAFADVPDHP